MIKRISWAILLLIFGVFYLPAQSPKGMEKKVLKAFYAGNLKQALEKSKSLLHKSEGNVTALFVAGESARRMHDFKTAENYLQKLPQGAKKGTFAATDYWLGQTKKHLGKYREAVFHFNQYLATQKGKEGKLAFLAKEEIKSCEWAMTQEKELGADLMEVEALPGSVNTIHADIAPLRYAQKLYFTSVVESGDKNAPAVTRIFTAIKNDPARLANDINPKNKNVHSSHTALMPDASRMYYTICKDESVFSQKDCEIFYRERQYEGGWSSPARLPSHINLHGYTATQPTVGWDRFLKKYVLYFVSDRPGGEGGLDIWGSMIGADGEYGDPFPVPFNSPQDEVTPFFHMPSQTLFFSSNGLPNLGGFDVFRSVKAGPAQWHLPVNLGMPLNTSYDEFYYTFHQYSKNAYFASNRPGAQCPDYASSFQCCDIFEAHIFAQLQVNVFNAEGNKPVHGTTIEIIDLQNRNSKKISAPDKSNQVGSPLELGKSYRVIVRSLGYKKAVFELTTEYLANFKTFEKDVFLQDADPSAGL